MKLILVLVLILWISEDSVLGNEPPNLEELEEKENWDEISHEICKKGHNKDIKTKIDKCQELDPYYKIDIMTKECEKLKAPPGSTWYDLQRGDCHYSDCYNKLIKTKEFDKINKELENVDDDHIVRKGYEKYKCIRKALAMKGEE